MLKKIMCIISTLIILISISIVPVSAEEATGTTTTTVNEWTVNHWSTLLGDDFDTSKYTEDVINNLLLMSDCDSQFLYYYPSYNFGKITLYAMEGDDIDLYEPGSIPPSFVISSKTKFDYHTFVIDTLKYNSQSSISASSNFYYCFSNNLPTGCIAILSNYNDYQQALNSGEFTDTSNIYYCPNPVESFIKYIQGVNIDLNKVVAPDGFTKSGIKYSSSLDSPYGKYLIKPYEDEQENLVTAGLFSDLDIYYDSNFNLGSNYDHSETINFYIDVSDVFVEDFGNTLFDYYNYKWDLPLNDFFNKHFRFVHYEKDYLTPLEFFQLSNKRLTSLNDVVSIEKVGEDYLLKFTLLSEYSVTYNVGVEPGTSNMTNSILTFTGSKITHTCKRLGSFLGDDNDNKGFGSDMSEADNSLSRPPSKDELKNMGFVHGFPNTQGSYPYKLTVYRNGIEYFYLYFNKMPSVSSTYYTNKCIDYGVNVNNTKIYMYFKEQHMSKVIDFTTNEDDMYYSDGHIFNNPITDTTLNILNSLLNVDTSEFNNTYTLHFWTNYTGTFENMNGFYCKFNWDLEYSGHFQKNNSDDEYDYTQDYMPEDSFTDNNGNIHGGAVEPPTEDPVFNGFNNQDFSFDENSLWDYADSFLNFCARAFKVLPAFIWQLIGCSMVVVIILRIVGR